MSTVTVTDGSKVRYLLKGVITSPNTTDLQIYQHPSQVPSHVMQKLLQSPLLALDFETRGNDISDPDFEAVGFAVSNGLLSIYIDLRLCTAKQKLTILDKFARRPLIGHNVLFDGGVFKRELGKHANWRWCTFGLFKQLSSESQALRWGLKEAQKELLGWTETNETELDQWLVDRGHHKQNYLKTLKEHSVGFYQKKEDQYWYKPEKGEMWRAPYKILGKYCALDAYSTFLLFDRVLEPSLHHVDYLVLRDYHFHDFLTEVEILIDAQLSGITIDRDALLAYEKELQNTVRSTELSFREHPIIAPLLIEFRETKLSQHKEKEPPKFKLAPKVTPEPNKFKKNGQLSKVWEAWNQKQDRILSWEEDSDNIRKDWIEWEERYTRILNYEEGAFNINSADHLKWLIYERLGYPIQITTASGHGAVNEDAIKQLGEEFKPLLEYKVKFKELGYVEKCVKKLRQDKEGYWRVHPQYICPGTLTGRLAGAGGLNVQQLPKTRGYLECWRPMQKGKTWFDCDWHALEPSVLTELTRDEGLMSVYGPGVQHQDIYLFFGSNIPGIGDKIRAAGYDPQNPTKEGLANAKKTCKKERSICKTVVLAKQYRAGARKIHSTLALNGVDVSLDEVAEICSIYDRTFKGVKDFSYLLEKEWKENNGWVWNGIGRPMTVAEDYLKDLVNRVCQSTGHDIHMKALRIVRFLLKKANIEYDWVIPDFHDQFLLECKKEDAPRIMDLINGEFYAILNTELDGLIPIKGDPQIVSNLADAKLD